jgi:hypothetical protein
VAYDRLKPTYIDTKIKSQELWNVVSCFHERDQTDYGEKKFLEKIFKSVNRTSTKDSGFLKRKKKYICRSYAVRNDA